MSDERLSRIESKLDKLAEVVVDLARVEERMASLFIRDEALVRQVAQLEKRMTETELQVELNKQVSDRVSKIFWTAITSVVTGMIGLAYFLLR